jgi:DNA-binding transcriptional LysR family regulator
MKAMQFPHIRSLDLSLVEPLYALLDERHVTRAAHRCDMSQSASHSSVMNSFASSLRTIRFVRRA